MCLCFLLFIFKPPGFFRSKLLCFTVGFLTTSKTEEKGGARLVSAQPNMRLFLGAYSVSDRRFIFWNIYTFILVNRKKIPRARSLSYQGWLCVEGFIFSEKCNMWMSNLIFGLRLALWSCRPDSALFHLTPKVLMFHVNMFILWSFWCSVGSLFCLLFCGDAVR